MVTTFLLFAIVLAPGMLIAQILRLSRIGVLEAVCLSLLVFLINIWLIGRADDSKQVFFVLYIAQLSILFMSRFFFRAPSPFRALSRKLWNYGAQWPYFLVAGFAVIYISVVGPYLEVPADVWQHLGAIVDYKKKLDLGLTDYNQPWYLLFALVLSYSGEEIRDVLGPFTTAATVLFLAMIYQVAELIYLDAGNNPRRAKIFGLLSALLTLATFGTTIFSYVRYYVFAPGYLCYPLFLYAAYIVVSVGRGESTTRRVCEQVGLVGVTLLVCYSFHKQEALLILLFCSAYIGYRIASFFQRKYWSSGKCSKNLENWQRFIARHRFGLVSSFVLLIGVPLLAAVSGSSWNIDRPLWNNTLTIEPFADWRWTIADPAGRVFETFGVLGLTLLLIYFAAIKRSDRVLVISILSLVPFLTLFNPLFCYYFIREIGDDTLWRIAYMFPIGLIAAHVICALVFSSSVRPKMRVLVGLILVGALIPIKEIETWQNSRWPSLIQVKKGNDYRVWGDLIEILGNYESANILTDSVTGYVVRAVTKHKVFGFKFHNVEPYIPINYAGYGPTSFQGYESWFFIQNSRNGEISYNGKISGHWPENIMEVSSRYSEDLLAFLEEPPPHFHLMWEKDGIRLFRISSTPNSS